MQSTISFSIQVVMKWVMAANAGWEEAQQRSGQSIFGAWQKGSTPKGLTFSGKNVLSSTPAEAAQVGGKRLE